MTFMKNIIIILIDDRVRNGQMDTRLLACAYFLASELLQKFVHNCVERCEEAVL
jgi:hypothetical protein